MLAIVLGLTSPLVRAADPSGMVWIPGRVHHGNEGRKIAKVGVVGGGEHRVKDCPSRSRARPSSSKMGTEIEDEDEDDVVAA